MCCKDERSRLILGNEASRDRAMCHRSNFTSTYRTDVDGTFSSANDDLRNSVRQSPNDYASAFHNYSFSHRLDTDLIRSAERMCQTRPLLHIISSSTLSVTLLTRRPKQCRRLQQADPAIELDTYRLDRIAMGNCMFLESSLKGYILIAMSTE
jgi:hypothetical protein